MLLFVPDEVITLMKVGDTYIAAIHRKMVLRGEFPLPPEIGNREAAEAHIREEARKYGFDVFSYAPCHDKLTIVKQQ